MTETKNLKLKTYETTTDGQELVARYIDNTSDNFQKIDEFCKTDTTLSVEGGIADAKTVGDNVSQLKKDLDNVKEKCKTSFYASDGIELDWKLGYYDSVLKSFKTSTYINTAIVDASVFTNGYLFVGGNNWGNMNCQLITFLSESDEMLGAYPNDKTTSKYPLTLVELPSGTQKVVVGGQSKATRVFSADEYSLIGDDRLFSSFDFQDASDEVSEDDNIGVYKNGKTYFVYESIGATTGFQIKLKYDIVKHHTIIVYFDDYSMIGATGIYLRKNPTSGPNYKVNLIDVVGGFKMFYVDPGDINMKLSQSYEPSMENDLYLQIFFNKSTIVGKKFAILTDASSDITPSNYHFGNVRNSLIGKKLSVIGDSEADGMLNQKNAYCKKIADRNGMLLIKLAKNSAMLRTGTGSSVKNIYDQADDIPEDSDFIVVHGGWNDYNAWDDSEPDDSMDTTKVKGAINSLFTKLQTNHADAKIAVILPYNYKDDVKRAALISWMNERAVKRFHIPTINGCAVSGIDAYNPAHLFYFENDGNFVHFSAAGHERISYIYEKWLSSI